MKLIKFILFLFIISLNLNTCYCHHKKSLLKSYFLKRLLSRSEASPYVHIRRKRNWFRDLFYGSDDTTTSTTTTTTTTPATIRAYYAEATTKDKSWRGWFSNIRSSIKRGFKKVGRKVKEGFKKIKRTFSPERTDEEFNVFVNALKERVEKGDREAVELLRELGIIVKFDETGHVSGSEVDENANDVNSILSSHGMLFTTASSQTKGENSTLSTPLTNLTTLSTKHTTLSTKHTTLSNNHTALSTKHTTLSNNHTALSTEHTTLSRLSSTQMQDMNKSTSLEPIISSRSSVIFSNISNETTPHVNITRSTSDISVSTSASSLSEIITEARNLTIVSSSTKTVPKTSSYISLSPGSSSSILSSSTKKSSLTEETSTELTQPPTTKLLTHSSSFTSTNTSEISTKTTDKITTKPSIVSPITSTKEKDAAISTVKITTSPESSSTTNVLVTTSRKSTLPPVPEGPTDPPPFPDLFKESHVRDRLHNIFRNADFDHDDMRSIFEENNPEYYTYEGYEYTY